MSNEAGILFPVGRSGASWAANEPASFNVGPPAWTRSVTKNRLLAAGYYGARYVGMEVFTRTRCEPS